MIIKSMSRREPSFSQLLAYVSRDASDTRYELRHNLLGRDIATMTAELQDNATLLPKRKNGVVMYHEIISITRARGLTEDRQKDILREIALDYIRERAPQCLAFGTLHTDQSKQLHYHLVISANPLSTRDRHRLTKKQFRDIQVGLERRVLTLYPELEQSLSIGRRAKPKQLSQAGIELQRRTGKTPEKQSLKARVAAIFAAAHDRQDLFKRLTDARLELYTRGTTIGLRDLDKDRNHRIATLGLDAEFKVMSDRLDAVLRIKPQKVAHTGVAPVVTVAVNLSAPSFKPTITLPLPRPSPNHQEPLVNIFEIAMNGLGAIADILSISKDKGAELEAEKARVKAAIAKTTVRPAPLAPHQTNPPAAPEPQAMTEIDRIAQERLAEMEALHDEYEQQRGLQDGGQLKR